MKWSRLLVLSLLVITSVAHASVGFLAEGPLGLGGFVGVSRYLRSSVRLAVNYDPFPSPTSLPGGCHINLTLGEANYLGTVYQWAASEVSPQHFETVVELDNGGEVTVSRSWTSDTIESLLDDGTNLTGVSIECSFGMVDEESLEVGEWLFEAAAP